MILTKMHLQTLKELHTMKEKVKERKEQLQQLYYKETPCHKPIPPLLLWYPCFSAACTTTTPGNYTTHQGIVTVDHQEEGN